MSAVLRGNSEGVLLRYPDPSAVRRHHVERCEHVDDRRRCALIAAEKSVRRLRVIVDHLALSDAGRDRIDDDLDTIELGLELKRPDFGMAPTR